jgi:hypothetical protein
MLTIDCHWDLLPFVVSVRMGLSVLQSQFEISLLKAKGCCSLNYDSVLLVRFLSDQILSGILKLCRVMHFRNFLRFGKEFIFDKSFCTVLHLLRMLIFLNRKYRIY